MLSILLLSSPVITLDGQPLDSLRRKNRALLYWLARRNAPLTRDEALAFLWPDHPRPAAQHILRTMLSELRRELVRLMETANQHHIQPRLGQRTIAQYRRGKRLRQLPAKLKLDLDHLVIAEGRVIFIRSVSARGRISLLGQSFQIGRRHKFVYVKTVLDTRRQRLTVYLAGKIFKRWPYKLSRH